MIKIDNCHVVDVLSGEIIRDTSIIIEGNKIDEIGGDASCDTTIDGKGMFALPGFIDPHGHLEVMYTPHNFSPAGVIHGTTCCISETHEFANIFGAKGIDFLMSAGKQSMIRIFFTIGSITPQIPEVEGPEKLSPKEIEEFMKRPEVVGLGEVISWPRVLKKDPVMSKKIEIAKKYGKTVEGHISGAKGDKIHLLAKAGITSCHESITGEEALIKLQEGLHVIIREGSIRREMERIVPFLKNYPDYFDRIMLSPDWMDPRDILKYGYMDHVVTRAIQMGFEPIITIQMATINPARYFGLSNLGAIKEGYMADILLVNDLKNPVPRYVILDGKILLEDSLLTIKPSSLEIPETIQNSVSISPDLSERDFAFNPSNSMVPCIEIVNRTITKRIHVEVKNDNLPDRISVIRLIDRWNGKKSPYGLVKGFDIEGFASTFSQDCHNLIVIGRDPSAMARCANRVIELGGGFVYYNEGDLIDLRMDVGGIASSKDMETLANSIEKFEAPLRDVTGLESPILTSGFLTFSSLPFFRMTISGMYDVLKGEVIKL
jgi:adenine deaminase